MPDREVGSYSPVDRPPEPEPEPVAEPETEQEIQGGERVTMPLPSPGAEAGLEPSGEAPPSQLPIPETPDEPGGQTAAVGGEKVYTRGSFMRDELGFETEKQYIEAQKRSEARGPLANKALEALAPFTTDYGIDVSGALRAGVPEEYIGLVVGKEALSRAAETGQVAVPAEFARDNMQLPSGEWVNIEEWNKTFEGMPEEQASRYQKIAFDPEQGLVAMGQAISQDYDNYLANQKEFEKTNIRLPDVPDGTWVSRYGKRGAGGELMVAGFENLDSKYQDIGREQGYTAMTAAIEADRVMIEDAITVVNKYKDKRGYNLAKAIKEGVSPETIKLAGFKDDDLARAIGTAKATKETGIALLGDMAWQRVSGEVVTDEQYRKIIAEKPSEVDYYRLSAPSGKRKIVELTSPLAFSAARIALPEVVAKDISGLEWAVSGAQLATWVLPIVPTKFVPLVSMSSAGVFGTSLAKDWGKLNNAQRAMGVIGTILVSLPGDVALARKAIPVAVKVPLADGSEITLWRGYTVGGKPAIGVSHSRLTLGSRGVVRPGAETIAEGYRPISRVETSLMGTRRAMTEMGAGQEAIDRVENALQIESHVSGRKSPNVPKEVRPEAIKTLTDKDIVTVIQSTQDKANKVQQVYGSMTIREQLPASLRYWRVPGDIDIQTGLTGDEVVAYAQRLLSALRRNNPGTKFEIPSRERGLIRVYKDGKWNNAIDLHGAEPVGENELSRVEALASISKQTGEYTYGLRVTQPSVTITYPGIGKVKFMALAESQRRKLDAILRWRGGKTVNPETHRVKDIVDFYVISKAYKTVPDEMLDEFLKLWGLTVDDVAKISEKYPTKMGVFEFVPSSGSRMAAKGSPSVSVSVPSYLYDAMPSLAKLLESPSAVVSPVSASATGSPSQVIGSGSPAMVSIVGGGTSPSVRAGSTSTGSSTGYSQLASVTPTSPSTGSPSGSPSPSPSTPPSTSPSPVSPSPGPVSPSPSFSPPSSPPSPSPVPVPEPVTPPSSAPTPPSPIKTRLQSRSPLSQPIEVGSIAWKQGLFWKYITPGDFTSGRKPQTLPEGVVPTGATNTDLRTPEETIQMIGQGRTTSVPRTITTDLGVVDIKVSERGRRIEFTGKGLGTDVGSRIAGPAAGMSVSENGGSDITIAELEEADKAIYGRKGVSRPTMSQQKPPRKKRRTSWLDDLTSLKGLRL